MNPTYTMSAHFYKSLYASWCQYRNPGSELPSPSSPATSPSPTSARFFGSPSSSRSASPEKRSLELERPGSGKSSA